MADLTFFSAILCFWRGSGSSCSLVLHVTSLVSLSPASLSLWGWHANTPEVIPPLSKAKSSARGSAGSTPPKVAHCAFNASVCVCPSTPHPRLARMEAFPPWRRGAKPLMFIMCVPHTHTLSTRLFLTPPNPGLCVPPLPEKDSIR